jgi:hypothetical protein
LRNVAGQFKDDADRGRAGRLADYRNEKPLAVLRDGERVRIIRADAGLKERLWDGRLKAAGGLSASSHQRAIGCQ